MPEELHHARPKRLCFVLLNGVGKVVRHARETVLRLVGEARRRLADAARLAPPGHRAPAPPERARLWPRPAGGAVLCALIPVRRA